MRLFVAVVVYDSIQTRYAYPIGIGIIASSEAGSVEPKERKIRRLMMMDVDGSDGGDDSLNKAARDTGGISLLEFREQRDWIENLSLGSVGRPKPGEIGVQRYKEEEEEDVEGTYRGGTGGEKKKGEERGGPPRWRTAESTAWQ
ncbi:hypothetical protein EV359DRAFT_66911 [Lentinula novae-zelandiae]|nr:hypothetical protein EV359DRAFT_66911 [Lentinula novae-zelandiae]